MFKYGVFSCPYFPLFKLNAEIYGVNLFTPNTRKYGPEKTPYLDTFHAVIAAESNLHNYKNHSKVKRMRREPGKLIF